MATSQPSDTISLLQAFGSIPQKMQAAKTGGCLTVLVPANQIFDSAWNRNLQELALDYKIKVQEVDTIDEAYRIMTTPRL